MQPTNPQPFSGSNTASPRMAVSLRRPIKLPQEEAAAASRNVISIMPLLRREGLVQNIPLRPRPLPPYKPAERDASTPANLVDVSSVTKTAALTVLVVCIFALITQALTGFTAIHPFVSVLLVAASILFYVMGETLHRSAVKEMRDRSSVQK
jgi:hypothetical protein